MGKINRAVRINREISSTGKINRAVRKNVRGAARVLNFRVLDIAENLLINSE